MLVNALAHKTSTERMVNIFHDVLLTGRPITLGVLGGSISAGGGLENWREVYIYDIADSLERLLRTKIHVRNGAVGGLTSKICLLCLNRFINTSDVDVFFWEFSANDYGRNPNDQELLTRYLLSLPQKPQLMYINFIMGTMIIKRKCSSNEPKGSVPLSKVYDIPSISESGAVCNSIQNNNASDLWVHTDSRKHPTREVHEMMVVF
ncbi:uncharacterized protein LOC144342606, partial [Saccoglossus kowalevskii]